MNDMSSAIIPKSDQTNADDLIAGPMTITIKEVQIKGGQEQPVSIFFDDSNKPYKPCKSMSRVLVAMWGADAKQYVGRSLTLYRDPTVKWAGMDVGGIRISHMSHIDREHVMALTATKGSRKPFKVLPLVVQAAPVVEVPPAVLEGAKAAAKKGEKALDAYVKTLTSPEKAALVKSGKGAEFRKAAQEADAPPAGDTQSAPVEGEF